MPVTDLRWRALVPRVLRKSGELVLEGEPVLEAVGARQVHLALGFSRVFDGRIWPPAIALG